MPPPPPLPPHLRLLSPVRARAGAGAPGEDADQGPDGLPLGERAGGDRVSARACDSYCFEMCDGSCATPAGDSLDAWQAALGAWTRRTFGGSRTRETLIHLAEEVAELLDAEAAGTGHEEEAADVLILLLCYADRRGFSLAEALARKHAVNLGRAWREGEDGMVRHV